MNLKLCLHYLSQLTLLEAALLTVPFFIAVGLGESTVFAFGITVAVLSAISFPFAIKKPKDQSIRTLDGLFIAALSWILMSVFGAVPLRISGYFPAFIDAFLENASGFTTTGITFARDVEALPKSILFWRSFSQWIGGMGFLVLFIAVLPKAGRQNIYLFRAESTLPENNMLVSKLRVSARIMYMIYIGLTVLLFLLLLIANPAFDSLNLAFTTASTGGFFTKNAIHENFNVYTRIILTIFMLLFSVNFNLYFLLMMKNVRQAVKNTELKWFLSIFALAVVFSTILFAAKRVYLSFGETVLNAAFAASSAVSTTGFIPAGFIMWPAFVQLLLVLLMAIGGCSGSASGGLKVTRVAVLFKTAARELRKSISPRTVVRVRMDKKPLETELVVGIMTYVAFYVLLILASAFFFTLDNAFSAFSDAISLSVATASNSGVFIHAGNAVNSAYDLSTLSKLVMSFNMIVGRLEMIPVLAFLHPKAWRY